MIPFRRALLLAIALVALFLLFTTTTHTTSKQLTKSRSTPAQHNFALATDLPPTEDTNNSSKDKRKDQIPISGIRQQPLRRQLEYHFPYDVRSKFPAYIWQTWKYAPSSGQFNDEWRPLEASWSELHPGFVHEVVTDSAAVNILKHFFSAVPDVVEAYTSLPRPVLKADFFRYLILLARGGIYTDMDTTALKSAVDWIPADIPRNTFGMVIGIEADPDRPDWKDWYSRRIQFCQWTIQAKPGHPVLREIVAKITEETLRKKKLGILQDESYKGTVDFTGPAIWTDTIMEFFNDATYFDMTESKRNISWREFTGMEAPRRVGDVIVLPITSFSPGVEQMGSKPIEDEMAFVHHWFEGKLYGRNIHKRLLTQPCRHMEARSGTKHWQEGAEGMMLHCMTLVLGV